MDISLAQLKIFSVVARTCNFTRAAEELFMSQPSVSAQIHNLERSTGAKLFEQLGKRVYLTEAGERLLSYANDMVFIADELETVMDGLRQNRSGRLRVMASPVVSIHLLPGILSAFRQEHGNIQVQLCVCKSSSQIVAGILQNTADIGLAGSTAEHPDFLHPDLVVRDFLRDQHVVIVGANHPWAGRSAIGIDEVVGEPLILQERGSSIRGLVDEWLRGYSSQCKPVLETNDTEVIKRAVAKGLGISIVSRIAVSGEVLDSSGLSVLNLLGAEISASFCLVMHRSKYHSPTIRSFLKLLDEFASSVAEKSRHCTFVS